MKIITGLFFLMVCGVTQAERYTLLPDEDEAVSKILPGWKIGGVGNPGIFFMHPGSIVRNGDIVDVWELGSYSEPKINVNGRRYQSDKSLHRYNCKNRTYQIITVTQYADSKAQGDSVDSFKSDNPPTYHIMPDSIGEMMMDASCEKTAMKKVEPPK